MSALDLARRHAAAEPYRQRAVDIVAVEPAQMDAQYADLPLAQLAQQLRSPTSDSIVFNDSCVLSCDTPFSPSGLFVNMKTFRGFGAEVVKYDPEPSPLYLHIKKYRVPKVEQAEDSAAESKVTKMAIGVDGGFQTDDSRHETVQEIHICRPAQLPFDACSVDSANQVYLPFPHAELPDQLSVVANAILNHVASTTSTAAAWEEAPPAVSKYAETLPVSDDVKNGVKKISPDPKQWRCEESGLTENLWLNLSDGYIGSGRQNWDGSGGTGAAKRHYEELLKQGKSYPLVVKLGTITPKGADVYSYAADEDDAVEDPHLAQHLARLGINIMQLEKTEKSTAELQIEKNLNYNWSAITEEGTELEPVAGPGFVGLRNLGNTCYMNSTLQCLASLPEFRTFLEQAPEVFASCPRKPEDDMKVQCCKLASALLTNKYVVDTSVVASSMSAMRQELSIDEPSSGVETYVMPTSFRSLIGRGHAEFSTNRQQDAEEFLQYLVSKLSQSAKKTLHPADDLSRFFNFDWELRLQGADGKVSYSQQEATVWRLTIPEDATDNQNAVDAYENEHREKKARTDPQTKEAPVLPNVPFAKVLEHFARASEIQRAGGSSQQTTRFKTFPRYLWIQLSRYTLDDKWQPKKLRHTIQMPETLDLSSFKGTGPQPGEDIADEAKVNMESPAPEPEADANIVAQIVGMGFSENAAKRAALAVQNAGGEQAANWIFAHMEDPDLNDPIISTASGPSSSSAADAALVQTICQMGFAPDQAAFALKQPGNANNPDAAVMWLFSNQDNLSQLMAEEASAAAAAALASDQLQQVAERDTQEREKRAGSYRLRGIISHLGKSTGSGHYVCHIRKQVPGKEAGPQWVIFNDTKVCISQSPPIQHGYLYLYEATE